jgi:nicotinate-nucleotide adenylyltransferase
LGRKLRVGIYGGSFNPVTSAHVAVAKYVMDRTGLLDEVWFMPCYNHMYDKKLEPPVHRVAMCNIAAAFDGRIKTFPYEIDNELSGATYQTLKKLLADTAYDEVEFYWIIGIDCANDFQGWADFEHLNRMAKFIVVPRKGIKPKASSKWFFRPPHIYLDPDENGYPTKTSVSSTYVRQTIESSLKATGNYPDFDEANLSSNIPVQVYDYLVLHKLYSERATDEQN